MKLTIKKPVIQKMTTQGFSMTDLQKEKLLAIGKYHDVNMSQTIQAMIDQTYAGLPKRARTVKEPK